MALAKIKDFAEAAVLALPQHVKVVLRMAEDQDLPDEARVLLAGAILHWLSSENTIPGVRGALAQVDDALVLRLVVARVVEMATEATEQYRQDAPDLFDSLTDDVAMVREELGGAMKVIDKGLEKLSKLRYLGHSPQECVHDEEAATTMYEEVQAALVDREVNESELAREIKRLGPLLTALAR